MPFRSVLWGLLAVLSVVAGSLPAHAQFATIRGRVTDATDAQPLPGAAVTVGSLDDGRRQGTAADEGGYVVLTRIPPGRYVLQTSFVGYLGRTDTLALDFGEQVTVELALEADESEMDEVVVEGERSGDAPPQVAFRTIRPSALARVPTPGVSADLAAFLQTQPGVVAQGDRGGGLFVRGGTPTQNLVLLDGMPIFQPFHIVGFYSAFPADLLAYADVYTGGFGARYGGRLSSVIDVATRNGNKQRVVGAASAAPFLSSARLEIPFVPQRVSILASVRESVIERVAPELLGDELPYRFGDRFAKVHAFLSRTSSLQLTGLMTYDRGDVADVDGASTLIDWRNLAYGGHYTYLPETAPVLAQIRFYVSQLDSRYETFSAPPRESDARAGGVEARFIYYLGETVVYAGVFGRSYGFRTDFGVRGTEQEEFISEGGMYIDVNWQVTDGWRLEPGLRMHSFPSRSQISFEPRLRASWRPGGRTGAHTFSTAWGLYRQDIIGLYNARDVTDAFVAWAPSPSGQDVPQARHALLGWQGRLPFGLSAGVEAYHKALDHLAFAEYVDGARGGIRIDPVEGTARGLEGSLEWLRPSVYAAVSYGLGQVTYRFEEAPTAVPPGQVMPQGSFSPPHDRRHQVNALLRLARGAYAFGARWQYGSGLPYTRAAGFYDALPVDPGGAFRTAPGAPVLIQAGGLYAARQPAYHRLDLTAERHFESRHLRATLQAGVINAYGRANLFDYDLFAGRRIDQLPLVPSLGLSVEVK